MRFKVGTATILADAFEAELLKHMHDAEEVSRRMAEFHGAVIGGLPSLIDRLNYFILSDTYLYNRDPFAPKSEGSNYPCAELVNQIGKLCGYRDLEDEMKMNLKNPVFPDDYPLKDLLPTLSAAMKKALDEMRAQTHTPSATIDATTAIGGGAGKGARYR